MEVLEDHLFRTLNQRVSYFSPSSNQSFCKRERSVRVEVWKVEEANLYGTEHLLLLEPAELLDPLHSEFTSGEEMSLLIKGLDVVYEDSFPDVDPVGMVEVSGGKDMLLLTEHLQVFTSGLESPVEGIVTRLSEVLFVV